MCHVVLELIDGEITITINNGAANFTYDLSGPIKSKSVDSSTKSYVFLTLIAWVIYSNCN